MFRNSGVFHYGTHLLKGLHTVNLSTVNGLQLNVNLYVNYTTEHSLQYKYTVNRLLT